MRIANVLEVGTNMRTHELCLTLFLVGCDSGVPVPGPPASTTCARVVPASASAVDYLAWIGGFDRVAALPALASKYSNGVPQTPAVASLPRFSAFRTEAVLAAQPDLVLCDWYQVGAVTRSLESAGVRIASLQPVHGIDDIASNVERVCTALGEPPERAAAEVARFRRAVADHAESELEARPRVLPYFHHGAGGRTAGKATIEDLMLRLAGARNVAREIGLEGHVRLPIERVVANPPRFFLTGPEGQLAALRASPGLADLEAVRENRVIVLESRLRSANSPFVLRAATELRRLLREQGVR